jgi:hypothetical protein
MSVNAPFTVTGNTIVITATTPAPAAVQAISSTLGGNQYRILNTGTVTAFLGFGATATIAATGANTPTGTVVNCLPLLPGTDEILTFVPNAYFSANATSSTVIYITPGDGS